ncbi:MAG: hypothetical protein QXD13_01310 [Candidatus Pacearchaeota archaeon]
MAQISKTKLKPRIKRKTNPEVAMTIVLAMKNPNWMKYAKILSVANRKQANVNLGEIDAKASMGDTILIPGKVLSEGEITKKIRICSFGISKMAREKLKNSKSDWDSILNEIKKNVRAEGLKIIK